MTTFLTAEFSLLTTQVVWLELKFHEWNSLLLKSCSLLMSVSFLLTHEETKRERTSLMHTTTRIPGNHLTDVSRERMTARTLELHHRILDEHYVYMPLLSQRVSVMPWERKQVPIKSHRSCFCEKNITRRKERGWWSRLENTEITDHCKITPSFLPTRIVAVLFETTVPVIRMLLPITV